MTGAEKGYLLLCCHLGNPERRPLTPAQLRKLARRVRDGARSGEDRDLEVRDLAAMGYGPEEAERIVGLLDE